MNIKFKKLVNDFIKKRKFKEYLKKNFKNHKTYKKNKDDRQKDGQNNV